MVWHDQAVREKKVMFGFGLKMQAKQEVGKNKVQRSSIFVVRSLARQLSSLTHKEKKSKEYLKSISNAKQRMLKSCNLATLFMTTRRYGYSHAGILNSVSLDGLDMI